jgi:hypothetical protein
VICFEGGTAGPSTSLRFGRDDTSVWGLGFSREDLGGPKGALQIPPLRSAPVGMTKGRVALPFDILYWDRGNSRSLTSLRSGRDDKGESGASICHSLLGAREQQVPPLRFAPVGMTLLSGGLRFGRKIWEVRGAHRRSLGFARDDKGYGGGLPRHLFAGLREQQVPPLRFAIVWASLPADGVGYGSGLGLLEVLVDGGVLQG